MWNKVLKILAFTAFRNFFFFCFKCVTNTHLNYITKAVLIGTHKIGFDAEKKGILDYFHSQCLMINTGS